jgi:hypothetical protein
MWLCAASLVCYAELRRSAGTNGAAALWQRSIPIRFSGALGRFELRRRGDGRRVEILAAEGVRAEVRATDLGDEIIFHHGIGRDELEEFGAALGQAIDLACAGEEAHVEWDDHSTADDRATDVSVGSGW